MKKILIFLLIFSSFLFSATCKKSEILGVFPKINGMNCNNYALLIGFIGLLSAYLFWEQVTK